MSFFIGICGNICTGKTSLCERLAAQPGVQVIEENISGNPYLAKFYDDMPTWAFRSQLRFLIDRHIAAKIATPAEILLEDRSILEDIDVFAGNLFEQGVISDDDWLLYKHIAGELLHLHPKYDLMIYLYCRTDEIMRRIEARGRPSEMGMDPAYIEGLQARYEFFVQRIEETVPIVRVDTGERDLRVPEQAERVFQQIARRVRAR